MVLVGTRLVLVGTRLVLVGTGLVLTWVEGAYQGISTLSESPIHGLHLKVGSGLVLFGTGLMLVGSGLWFGTSWFWVVVWY